MCVDFNPLQVTIKKFSIICLLIFFGTGCALAILEIYFQFYQYEGCRERDKLGSRFKPYYSSPDAATVFKNEGLSATAGLMIHNEFVPFEKPADEKRVLFIGDSGTFGSGVPFPESFPLQYRAILERCQPGNHIRVINAGRKGLSTVGELRLLKDRLLSIKPDIIVLGLFMANDINFNLAHANAEVLSLPTETFLRSFYFLRRHSALVHFIYLRLLVLNREFKIVPKMGLYNKQWIPVEYRLSDITGLSMVNYLDGEIALYRKAPSDLASQAFSLLDKQFLEFKNLALNSRFKPIVITIPTLSSVVNHLQILTDPNALQTLARSNIFVNESELDFQKPIRETLKACAKNSLICIETTSELSDLGVNAYLAKDDHLSIAGHQRLACKLARALNACPEQSELETYCKAPKI